MSRTSSASSAWRAGRKRPRWRCDSAPRTGAGLSGRRGSPRTRIDGGQSGSDDARIGPESGGDDKDARGPQDDLVDGTPDGCEERLAECGCRPATDHDDVRVDGVRDAPEDPPEQRAGGARGPERTFPGWFVRRRQAVDDVRQAGLVSVRSGRPRAPPTAAAEGE